MRRPLILLTLWLAATASAAVAQSVLPREVRTRLLQAVVEVVAYDPGSGRALGAGSGTIVSEDGFVLTNFHVLDDGTGTAVPWAAIFVSDPAAPDRAPYFRYWARFVDGDPVHDFALVEIVEDAEENPLPPGTTFASVAIGDSGALLPGDPITVVGYPGISGATITFTSGIVSGFLGEDLEAGGKQWIKTDAKLARGNSGGGAFDQSGVLVGIPTLGRQTSDDDYLESQDYLRPVNLAWPLLSRNVAGIERVGGVSGQLVGEEGRRAGPSPLEVARSGGGAQRGAATAVPADPDAISVERGTLAAGDLQLDSGEYVDVYAYDMVAGVAVRIELASDAIDPYLLVLDPADEVVLEVDDSAGAGLNVAETFVPREDGSHLVVVTSAFPAETGGYELRVKGAAASAGALPPDAAADDAGADDGFRAPAALGTDSGFAGALRLGEQASAELAALPDAAAFHTYRIDVPAGTPTLTIRLRADADLDLFVKFGSEIVSYGEDGDWELRDIDVASQASIEVRAPTPGAWYVDVAWLVGEAGDAARYTLRAE